MPFDSETAWNERKLDEIENFGREAVRRAAALPAIACLAQASSRVVAVAGETRFVRLGNSIVYDDRRISIELKQQVGVVPSHETTN
jgi:hypothetical protein